MDSGDMKVLRKNQRITDPKVSLVLLDWGCRESFHTVEYLNHLVTPRDQYEIIWVEYYDRRPSELVDLQQRYESHGRAAPIDTWIVMARPKGEVFRKHWMNNVGLLNARGEIVVFMDSDAITSTTFVETILLEFKNDPDVILYIEEIRTGDASFYPFSYPNPKEIIPVASNLANGVPLGMRNFRCGLLADPSLIHWRNYGACFGARRNDIIRVGGWDEHDDYTGYIAGPYEMSMRMEWSGKRERWSFRELLWHVPHPGNDGIDNFSGPHDGKGVSTTAMEIINSRRTLPLRENPHIRELRVSMFGESAPPAVEQRPAKRHVHEPKPTSPVPSNRRFLPIEGSKAWNNDQFHMIGRFIEDTEIRVENLEYPRAFALGAYAACIAKQLNLPQERVEGIYIAAMMGSLDTAACAAEGPKCLLQQGLADLWRCEPLLTAAKVSAAKGQRYDGKGCAARGKQIPLEARIVAVAQKFDELVNLRSAGAKMEFSLVWRAIEDESSRAFDPQVVDAARACLEDLVCVHLRCMHDSLGFMYPCYKYEVAKKERPEPKTQPLGEFYVLTSREHSGSRYALVPTWNDPTAFYTCFDREEILRRGQPQTAVSNYHGHNILLYAGRYFAVPHGMHEFKLAYLHRGDYGRRVLASHKLAAVKHMVLAKALKRKAAVLMLKPARSLVRRVLG
jgi:hypothetical protein